MAKKFKSKKYMTLHKRVVRSGDSRDAEKKLLEDAMAMFSRMESKKEIRDFAAQMSDRVIRFDLMGSPEVSFFIIIDNGKLRFNSEHMPADLAFGISKELFSQLIEEKPNIGNLEFILNNISFRKGTVRECLRLKSMLIDTVFSGGAKNEK